MTNFAPRTARFLAIALLTGQAGAQTVVVTADQPSIDRWVYPFGSAPGYEFDAKTFGALGQETAFPPLSFDQRDGQMLVGFDLDAAVPPGRGSCGYRITSAVLALVVSNDRAFQYDPTYDPWQSYLSGAADADGRPVELYGAAFRNGWTACAIDAGTPSLNQFPCYYEGDPANPGPPFGPGAFPTSDTRHAYPTDFAGRVERDVSNNVRDQFDPSPFAIGQIAGLATGAPVPVDSEMTFTLNVNDADAQAFLRRACDSGLLRLMVTSLQPASSGGGGGPGTGAFASFYCKEIGVEGLSARLSMSVRLTPPGDSNASGTVDFADITTTLTNWGGAGPNGDANCDGAVNFSDITEVLSNWGAG